MNDVNKQIEEAKALAKKVIVIENKDKFSNEADMRVAEYLCYKALKEQNKSSRWRKVRDELPEEGEVVVVRIVFLSNRECNIQKGFMYDIAIYHPRDKEFYSRASIAPSMYEICDPVIEWKPIY